MLLFVGVRQYSLSIVNRFFFERKERKKGLRMILKSAQLSTVNPIRINQVAFIHKTETQKCIFCLKLYSKSQAVFSRKGEFNVGISIHITSVRSRGHQYIPSFSGF